MENASSLWPISLHATRLQFSHKVQAGKTDQDLQVLVSGHKEEVVVDKLLPHFLVHPSERVVGAGKVALSWEFYNNSLNKLEMKFVVNLVYLQALGRQRLPQLVALILI